VIAALAAWLEARTRAAGFVRRALHHVFPDHWSFLLGEIALYAFLVLVLTGIFLAAFYQGSATPLVYHGAYRPLAGTRMSAAFASLLHLSFDVRAGLLVRQMHHWAANLFLAAILAHLARIYFTSAYRKPRELNWMIGLAMLGLALANGFFGYSLGDDMLSGAGLRIGDSLALSVPLVGPWLAGLAFGGAVPTPATLPRLYAWHIVLIPALLAALIAAHLALIWRQLHTNFPAPGRAETRIVGSHLWPGYALKSLGLLLAVFAAAAALGAWVQIDPVWVYGPCQPTGILTHAQPDWYLGWVEGAMRLAPAFNAHLWGRLIPEVFFPGVLFPALVFTLLFSVPFVEKRLMFDPDAHNLLCPPSDRPVATALGCAVFALMMVLEIAAADDVLAVAFATSLRLLRALLRIAVFAVPLLTGVAAYWLCRWRRRARAAAAATSPTPAAEPARAHRPAA
jgi:ubiquinol-cytochrome c reductase cytochrome b subunit